MTEPLTDRAIISAGMLAYLTAYRGWHTRKQLRDMLGYNAKQCQHACADSEGAIMFGQRGYRATIWATTEDIEATIIANSEAADALTLRNDELMDIGTRQGRW